MAGSQKKTDPDKKVVLAYSGGLDTSIILAYHALAEVLELLRGRYHLVVGEGAAPRP